jgi:hypothetical protein
MTQLIEKNIINTPVWSLVLINGKDGIFSIGGTSAPSHRRAAIETDDELTRSRTHGMKRDGIVESRTATEIETEAAPSSIEWKWSKVQGAEGWWQILMRGIWVDGIKALENQPIVLDMSALPNCKLSWPNAPEINTPFILAPPIAARAFYSSISGSRQLPLPMISSMHTHVSTHPKYISSSRVGMLRSLKVKGTRGLFHQEEDSHWDAWSLEVVTAWGLLLNRGWVRKYLLGLGQAILGLEQLWKERMGWKMSGSLESRSSGMSKLHLM